MSCGDVSKSVGWGCRAFDTTCWSVVERAREHPGPEGMAALEELCRTYYTPLFRFVIGRGYSPHDAQDLVQGFFESLVRHREFAQADPQRGRFRSFLLGTLKHYLSDERKRATARKRGAGQSPVSWEEWTENEEAEVLSGAGAGGDVAFDREWALSLARRVLDRLAAAYERSGRSAVWTALLPALLPGGELASCAGLAERLGLTENGVKSAVRRLRAEFAVLLRDEVAATVSDPADVDAELRHLMTAWCTHGEMRAKVGNFDSGDSQ